MSIEKKFLKTKPVCKVKFSLNGGLYTGASSVSLAGDFNNWQADQTPMKKSKEGVWSVTLDLPSGNAYQYKFLVNGTEWINDPAAERLVPGGMGSENSLLEI